jgi:hypothetical protein
MSEVGGEKMARTAVIDWQEPNCILAYSAADWEVQVSSEIEILEVVVLYGCGQETEELASTLLLPRVRVRSPRAERHMG